MLAFTCPRLDLEEVYLQLSEVLNTKAFKKSNLINWCGLLNP